MAAVPRPDAPRERLAAIPGQVPPATAWPAGCRFHPRCPLAWEKCRAEMPPLLSAGAGREARCWLVEDDAFRGTGAPAHRGDETYRGTGVPAHRGEEAHRRTGAPAHRGDESYRGTGAPGHRDQNGEGGRAP
jgi:oligopeptide/dipeptide ABC transporter ATP-binding protein